MDGILEYDEATQNLVSAAMATAAARAAGAGFHESVQALLRAAMALPGCRFAPTDEELIRCYLQKKVKAEPIPLADHMREANVMLQNPMTLAATLPKLGDRDWYFFTPRVRRYKEGRRPNRESDGGFWKATGADNRVTDAAGEIIGYKRALVYYLQGEKTSRDSKDIVKTSWVMYEFRLNQAARTKESPGDMRLDDWVLCSIHEQVRTRVANRKRQKNPPADQPDNDGAVENPDANLEQQQQQPPILINNNNTIYQQDHHLSTLDVQQEQEQELQFMQILDPVQEQEQYAQQLLINNGSTSTSACTSASAEAEQYGYHQPYLEQQQQQPLISSNAEPAYYGYQKDLHVPDNGINDDWNELLNFITPENCLNIPQQIKPFAAANNKQQLCPCLDCQHQHTAHKFPRF